MNETNHKSSRNQWPSKWLAVAKFMAEGKNQTEAAKLAGYSRERVNIGVNHGTRWFSIEEFASMVMDFAMKFGVMSDRWWTNEIANELEKSREELLPKERIEFKIQMRDRVAKRLDQIQPQGTIQATMKVEMGEPRFSEETLKAAARDLRIKREEMENGSGKDQTGHSETE